MSGADPWARNDNGLHKFDTTAGVCRGCGVAFLDAAGLCPGPGGELGRQETITRVAAGVPDLEVPLVDRGPQAAVERPGPAGGIAAHRGPGTPGSGQPGDGDSTGFTVPLSPDDPNLQAALGPPGPHRIRCITGTAQAGQPDPEAGCWLAAYDPDANAGGGYIRWARHPSEAMIFTDLQAAVDYWEAGGQPHRPLSAYSVEFVAAGR